MIINRVKHNNQPRLRIYSYNMLLMNERLRIVSKQLFKKIILWKIIIMVRTSNIKSSLPRGVASSFQLTPPTWFDWTNPVWRTVYTRRSWSRAIGGPRCMVMMLISLYEISLLLRNLSGKLSDCIYKYTYIQTKERINTYRYTYTYIHTYIILNSLNT